MNNTLAYLVYGNNEAYIAEARFSILSAVFRSENPAKLDIVALTDSPDQFADLPVSVIELDQETLDAWAGAHQYHHRRKPEALRFIANRAEKIALVDTDTVFLRDPMELFERIGRNKVMVDALEGRYGAPGDVYYQTCREILEKKYHVSESLRWLNSGLIGIHRSDVDLIKRAIELIDELYLPSGKVFHVEQFALAVAAFSEGFDVAPHNGVLHHYWSRKHIYRAIAKAFLCAHPELLSEVSRADFLALEFRFPKPPGVVRFWYKFLAQFVKDRKQLRQFYIELRRAMYSYHGLLHEIRGDMAVKAFLNLKERNPDLYGEVLKNGVESVIAARLFPKGVLEEVAAAVRDTKDLD